jgi:hypothetical protein
MGREVFIILQRFNTVPGPMIWDFAIGPNSVLGPVTWDGISNKFFYFIRNFIRLEKLVLHIKLQMIFALHPTKKISPPFNID